MKDTSKNIPIIGGQCIKCGYIASYLEPFYDENQDKIKCELCGSKTRKVIIGYPIWKAKDIEEKV